MSELRNWQRCATCGGYDRVNSHRCPPAWEVMREGEGSWEDCASTFYAIDAEEAAKRWAEDFDQNGDYRIVGQHSEPFVLVRPRSLEAATEPQRFRVTGEAVPVYYAHPEPKP